LPKPASLARISQLPWEDRAWLGGFLADRPLFQLFFDTIMADLADRVDHRWGLIGAGRAGCILAVEFESMAVFTALGTLAPRELAAMLDWPAPAELHVERAHESALLPLYRDRLRASRELRIYYRDAADTCFHSDIRLLTPNDFDSLIAFMRTHNPGTPQADWMLSLPIAIAERGGEIVAVAGTIVRHGKLALLGNFVTRPDWRGRGLAGRLAHHLMAELRDDGVETVMLTTIADNVAACRSCERAGFQLMETRRQVDLAALASCA
jgi:RimJ/RimL family protein N-acetyltransferase